MSVECLLHDTLDDSKAAARQPGRVLGGESLCRPLGQTGHQIGLEEENAKDGGQEMVRVCKPALRTHLEGAQGAKGRIHKCPDGLAERRRMRPLAVSQQLAVVEVALMGQNAGSDIDSVPHHRRLYAPSPKP